MSRWLLPEPAEQVGPIYHACIKQQLHSKLSHMYMPLDKANHLTAFLQLLRYIHNYTVPGNILPPLSSSVVYEIHL